MLRSQTLTPLWDTSMELGKASCRVKMVSKYQVDTKKLKTKLRGLSLRANYTARAAAAGRRSSANFCG